MIVSTRLLSEYITQKYNIEYIRNTKIMFPYHRLLSEYSSEEQKLRELSERVLHFERKDPTQWIVQVFTFVFETFYVVFWVRAMMMIMIHF